MTGADVTRRIVALGGAGFSMDAPDPRLDDHLLSLAATPRPKVLFVPTASGALERQLWRCARRQAANDSRSCGDEPGVRRHPAAQPGTGHPTPAHESGAAMFSPAPSSPAPSSPAPRHRRSPLLNALDAVSRIGSAVTLAALLVVAGAVGGAIDGSSVPADATVTITVDER